MRFNRPPGVLDHDGSTWSSRHEMGAAAHTLCADELLSRSLFRYRRLILPGLAPVPDRGYWPYRIKRVVATGTSNSSRNADIDLPEPDGVLYVCALAPIF
jgi:hypothetical protein